jgi:hypothetical protein
MAKVVLSMSMSLDGSSPARTTDWITDSASTESGCMTGCVPAAWILVRTGPSTDPTQSCSTS